jgi:hypothetical protein
MAFSLSEKCNGTRLCGVRSALFAVGVAPKQHPRLTPSEHIWALNSRYFKQLGSIDRAIIINKGWQLMGCAGIGGFG